MEYMLRYLLPEDLVQLGTLLDGMGNFSDEGLDRMAAGWRSCVGDDGRLRGRVNDPSPVLPMLEEIANSAGRRSWWHGRAGKG